MCQHHNLDWQKFIDGGEVNREEYQEALATCTKCFQEYLGLLEGVLEAPFPDFTEKVMATLPDFRRNRYAYKPLLHYLVAACITLIFIELGAFDWIGSRPLVPEVGFFFKLMEGLGGILGELKTNLGGM